MASVRETIIAFFKTQLAGITKDAGYSRTLGVSRVLGIRETPSGTPVPAVFVMQGEEIVDQRVGDRYSCLLELAIGFVDHPETDDPDSEANLFMSEIQKVIPIEFNIQCPNYPLGTVVDSTVVAKEIGNTINITMSTPGLVIGQVTYEVAYRRSIFNPDMF